MHVCMRLELQVDLQQIFHFMKPYSNNGFIVYITQCLSLFSTCCIVTSTLVLYRPRHLHHETLPSSNNGLHCVHRMMSMLFRFTLL